MFAPLNRCNANHRCYYTCFSCASQSSSNSNSSSSSIGQENDLDTPKKISDDAESLLTEAPSNSFDPQNRVRGRVRVRGRLKLQIALRYSDSSVSKRSTRRVSIATTRPSISLPD